MKTIKELEAEDTCHEDSYFKAGQIQAYEDVLKLIDEQFNEYKFKIYCNFNSWLREDIKELKSKIIGEDEKE